MKKSKDLVTNIGDILTGNYDPDFVMTLIELMDPVTLSRVASTHSFLTNYSVDEKIWKKHVERDISDSPKLRDIYDEKLQHYRAETYKEMYARVGKLILQ